MSSAQLVSCVQLPTTMDPILGTAQQNNTMWLQQDHTQPTVVLSQGCMPQQTVDAGLWGMSAQQGMQQQAGGGMGASTQANPSSTGSMDVSKLSAVLQDILVSLQPAASQPVSTASGLNSSTPLVLQLAPNNVQGMQQQMAVVNMQGNMQQQPMQQQVLTSASGEQVLVIGGGQGTLQQQVPATLPAAGADGNGAEVQMLLQQLQNALQRVPGDTAAAAVQQVLMCVQASQPQTSQANVTMLASEGTVMTSSYMINQPSGLPAHMAACNNNATASPVAGSFHSNWQSMDNLCSSSGTSSPAYTMHNTSAHGAANSAQGPSMLRVMSGPQMPQPHMQNGGNSFSQGMPSNAHMQRVAMAPGAGMVAMPVGGMQQPQQADESNCMVLGCVPDNQMHAGQQYQPGRLQHNRQQQQFRGNTPYGVHKGRAPAPAPKQPMARAGPAQDKFPAGPGPRPADSYHAQGGAPPAPAGGLDGAGAGGSASSSSGPGFSGPAAHISLDEGLKQLWTGEQLQNAKGGRLFNIEQRMAWQPVGEPDPDAQDLFDFTRLKHVMQKLDAVHRTRVKLIKRLHAVADYGGCDAKSVYFEVRCMIGEMMHNAAAQGRPLHECRITGLVRLAIVLQHALELGPKEGAVAAAAAAAATAAAADAATGADAAGAPTSANAAANAGAATEAVSMAVEAASAPATV